MSEDSLRSEISKKEDIARFLYEIQKMVNFVDDLCFDHRTEKISSQF